MGAAARHLRALRRPSFATKGYAIRSEPAVAGRLLAAVSQSASVDLVQQIDRVWAEVSYADGDVTVQGFASKQQPPVPTRPRRTNAFVANVGPDAVPDRTCLYANGEPVGVVVGEARGTLAPGMRPGWFTFTVDTPWDLVTFDVHGSVTTQLTTCTSSLQ